MKQYRIGDYAKYLGVTPDLLKHYEDMGIIHSERSESGYRYYSFITTIELIESIRLRNYGLTLREIQTILTEHRADNAQMETLFDDHMERLRQEVLLNEALREDYADFLRWKEPLERRDWDWEIRWGKRMLFLPHTEHYDFLKDPRIYELLTQWMSYIPIVKSAMKMEADGRIVWGFLVEERMAEGLRLPLNDVVECIPARKIFCYQYRGPTLRMGDERPDNEEHPAFAQLRALSLRGGFPRFRVTLMPADWQQSLGYQYAYYAIPLAEQ